MPDYIRWRTEGATYFFTVVTYRRQHILTHPIGRRILHEAIQSVRQRLPFELAALVLLPDHLHCLMALPTGDDRFSTRLRQIKGRFTHEYLKAGGRDWAVSDQSQDQGRRGTWQPRFWEHRIRDEQDYLGHRDYIHMNPVKHGYVRAPNEWPWSSFHRYVELGWLDPNWPGSSPPDLPHVDE